MNEQRVNYLISAVLVVAVLVAGFFGVTLPVQPVIPTPLPTMTPLPTATPVDLGPLADDVADVGARVDDLEARALSGMDAVSFSAYSVPCYRAQGGDEWVAGSGCTWTVASGATLDVQSGSTVTLTAASIATPTVGGYTFTVSAPITITGVLTDVRVLYYQEP